MRRLPLFSKAYLSSVVFLSLLTVFAIQPTCAQDLVGGASRKDLSGGSEAGDSKRTTPRRPKVPNTSTTTAVRVVERAVPSKEIAGTLSVATEPGATILVEPIIGGESFEAQVEKGERVFVFRNIKPGRYRVAAELAGFGAQEQEVVVLKDRPAIVTLDLKHITEVVTIVTNVLSGEVRFAPVVGTPDANGEVKYVRSGDMKVTSIVNGRATLSNLPLGTYGIDIRAEEIGYKTLLATFTLPGQTTFDIKLERLPKQAPTRILEQVVEGDKQTTASSGRYFALVIGNNNYTGMSKLKTAEDDAREVADLLSKRYGFDTKLLLNANRQKIIGSLVEYRRILGANDSLLIYYAGHGYRDAEADQAYWLPVDATKDDNSNWISADDVTRGTKVIPAKHILIVSDSCYSGTLYRDADPTLSTPIEREKYLEKMKKGKSRNLMASGGNEPVTDGGGGRHSIFAKALLIGLNEIEKTVFTAMELFQEFVQQRVAGGSNQTPEYNSLKNSGHESGDFVFQRTP